MIMTTATSRPRPCRSYQIPTTVEDAEPLNNAVNEPSHPYVSRPLGSSSARSMYALTRREMARGIANRFVHSRSYIFLYLIMAAFSVTTVVLSLHDGCPGLPFYVLEVIINTSMILEVSVRLVAFGRQFWRSPFNVFDLILTVFCAMTLLVLAFAGCGATSKEEELLDTLLLIARNVLQFGRLASVMRQSGQSIFSRPKPIDITAVGHSCGIQHCSMPKERREEERSRMTTMPRAAQAIDERDAVDVWAEIG
ncbi:hypothetical protein BKA83DRAFT_671267 [Pisolithus microcarpus]|nr:hypothetical protein BKA83DRAFT_671267 [Pisolithus microcarpus]